MRNRTISCSGSVPREKYLIVDHGIKQPQFHNAHQSKTYSSLGDSTHIDALLLQSVSFLFAAFYATPKHRYICFIARRRRNSF